MGLQIIHPNTCIRGCCTSDSIPLHLPPPSYTILLPNARGAESVVYDATLDGKRVAVKKPVLSTSEDINEFHKELQLLCCSKLDHEGIATLVAAHARPPNYMFFFEFYEFGNLSHKLHVDQWSPSVDQALMITKQLANALQYLHNIGIVHRDVKPANVLLDNVENPAGVSLSQKQKGSLENHLFKSPEPLPWSTRIKIATGAAQGLAFLHTTEKTVIYRDFKSANILLDGDFNAKLSDFGLAKLGPSNGASHVSTRVVGTYGYAAPEYIATGHLYVRSDVYGFGVVLLEMITGLRVVDTNRPGSQHNLVDWARPALGDKKKLQKMMDPRLENDYPSKGARKAAELILRCLEHDPKNRPSMEEVVVSLQEISDIKTKPKDHTTQSTGPHHVGRYQSPHRSPLHGGRR